MNPHTLAAAALIAALLIFLMVVLGSYLMVTGFAQGATLTDRGLRSLRYFTVQSNLLVGLSSLLYAVALIPVLRGRANGVPAALQILQLAATASVGLTFLVVTGFFIPVLHSKDMFVGPNLWFHLVVPLAAIVSFPLLFRFAPLPRSAILWSAVPMLLYGSFYTLNCLLHGTGDYQNPATLNDWYWFLHWGLPVGIAFFVGLCAVTMGLAALLRAGNLHLPKK